MNWFGITHLLSVIIRIEEYFPKKIKKFIEFSNVPGILCNKAVQERK